MVNKRELQQYYKQNIESEKLDIPDNAMITVIYNGINIDYVINQRIKENLMSNKEYIYVDKADFTKSIEEFKESVSYNISPRGGILINYSCKGAIEGTQLHKNTVESIMSVCLKDSQYNYSKLLECVSNELNKNGINNFIESEKVKIDLNQFRSND